MWRFFGYYNKGESVSDSWAFALLDEFVENCPATAAYGNTVSDAVESLLHGRFTEKKAQSKDRANFNLVHADHTLEAHRSAAAVACPAAYDDSSEKSSRRDTTPNDPIPGTAHHRRAHRPIPNTHRVGSVGSSFKYLSSLEPLRM